MPKYLIAAILMLTANCAWGAPLQVDFLLHADRLECEYLHDPQGIDALKPSLLWRLSSAGRGDGQTAYRILVASSAELLLADRGDLWDSGKVLSRETAQVEYGGSALVSGERCFWKVMGVG